MRCPFCRNDDSRVVETRAAEDGISIKRRRECVKCLRRFPTVETVSLSVVKRNGSTEPFSREKVMQGVRKACQGRPVQDADLALLAQDVEEELRASGQAHVDARAVGRAILKPLSALDQVAYLRFASVYRDFDSVEDFETAIRELRSRDRAAEDQTADVGTASRRAAADPTQPGITGSHPHEPTLNGNHPVGSEQNGEHHAQ